MFPKMAYGIVWRKSLLWRKFLGGVSVGVHNEQMFFQKERKVGGKTQRGHTSFSLWLSHSLCSMCILSKCESSLQARVKLMQRLHFSPQHSHYC